MRSVLGIPAYWKHFLYEELAMVKQLGMPTHFLTLSCADLKWNELSHITNKLNNSNLTDEEHISNEPNFLMTIQSLLQGIFNIKCKFSLRRLFLMDPKIKQNTMD